MREVFGLPSRMIGLSLLMFAAQWHYEGSVIVENPKKNVHIVGVGAYLPPFSCDNNTVADLIGGKWKGRGPAIGRLVGINNRMVAGFTEQGLPDPASFELMDEKRLALEAAKRALSDAGCTVADITWLIYVTGTLAQSRSWENGQLQALNNGALFLHHSLGLSGETPADGRDRACGGFLAAIREATLILKNPEYQGTVLIVVSNDGWSQADRELYRKTDAITSLMVFGSGAGAVVLRADEREGGIVGSCQITDSNPEKALITLVPDPDFPNGRCASVIMSNAVSENFIPGLKEVIQKVQDRLQQTHPKVMDPDLFLLHQPNGVLTKKLIDAMNVSPDKIPVIVDNIGNVSGAGIPILMAKLKEEGKLQSGMGIICAAIGHGDRAALYWVVP